MQSTFGRRGQPIKNLFLANVPILHFLISPEKQRFSDDFRECKLGTLARNGLLGTLSQENIYRSSLPVFLENSQNPQENAFARVSFLIKLQN